MKLQEKSLSVEHVHTYLISEADFRRAAGYQEGVPNYDLGNLVIQFVFVNHQFKTVTINTQGDRVNWEALRNRWERATWEVSKITVEKMTELEQLHKTMLEAEKASIKLAEP